MNGGNFSKLFASIITSTIWREADYVRCTWVTMLAICDRHGVVRASVPGLAAVANVSIEHCLEAIDKFLSPDPWSRTKTDEGRRIEVIEGGWRLLNYEAHRDGPGDEGDVVMTQEAIRSRRYRRNRRDGVTGRDDGVTPSASASSSASGEESQNKDKSQDSLEEKEERPGVKRLAEFMATHDFGRWNGSVEGYIRASRVPLAIIAELELWIAGELNRRKTDPETLGEALNAYAAATPGDPRFQTNYFGGFVRGVHRNRERNEGNRRNSAEARTIVAEERAAEERRQEEGDRAMVVAFERDKPARFAELKAAAEAKVDREMPKAREKTPQMWATLVNDELIRTVREETR